MDLRLAAIRRAWPQWAPSAVQHGNLFASLLSARCPLRTRGQLALVAGVVAYDTAAKLLPEEVHSELLLKWPNDVLLKGGKVAGMLLESASEPAPTAARWSLAPASISRPFRRTWSSQRRAWPRMAGPRRLCRLRDPCRRHRCLADALGRGRVLPDGAAGLARPGRAHRAASSRAPARRGGRRDLCRARSAGALRLLMSDGAERRIAAGDVFFANS